MINAKNGNPISVKIDNLINEFLLNFFNKKTPLSEVK